MAAAPSLDRRNPGAAKLHAEILACCVFPPRRFSGHGGRPQNGSASTGKLNYSSVRCGNRSMSWIWIKTKKDAAT